MGIGRALDILPGLLFIETQDPFNFRLFQAVFGMVLTILIAMEFNKSIVRTMEEDGRLSGAILALGGTYWLLKKAGSDT